MQTIQGMTLHDIRPGEDREITNLIQRRVGSDTSLNPDYGVIKITFRTDAADKKGSTCMCFFYYSLNFSFLCTV